MTMDVGSGGGVRMQLMVVLAVPDDICGELDGSAGAMHVPLAHLGRVNEDYLASVAAAVSAAAALIPGAIRCTLVGPALVDDLTTSAPVEVELLATVNAARDALLETLVPFAEELDRLALWRPELERCGPYARVGTQWLVRELQLLAVIEGPLGRHTRVLLTSALGTRATITR